MYKADAGGLGEEGRAVWLRSSFAGGCIIGRG